MTRLSTSAAETEQVGFEMAQAILSPAFVCLYGELGAGKTTFAKGFARGLGVGETVRSPSFALIMEYPSSKGRFLHVDLYRLEDSAQILNLGLDELAEGAIVLVEWADRLGDRSPTERIDVRIKVLNDDRREIEISPSVP